MTKARAVGFNPKSISLKGVVTYKVLDLSTGHITSEDNALLVDDTRAGQDSSDPSSNVCMELRIPGGYVMPYAYGWLVRVFEESEEGERATDDAAILEMGFSQAFANLVTLCRTRGFGYLRLDQDGDLLDDLPSFDW